MVLKSEKAFSLKTVAVLYGFTSRDELFRHKPGYVINRIDELLEII